MKYRKFMGIGPKTVTRRGTPGKWMAALASALLLCACAATEPLSEKNIFSDTPVSFDAFGRWDDNASGAADTRTTSNGAETTFDNGDAIGVMAYYIPEGATADATAPNFMYNQKVTYSASSSATGAWTYSPVKYWPVSGKVNFYAYSPYAGSGDKHITLSPNTAVGLPTLSYTNKNADIDLMAASSENQSWNVTSSSAVHPAAPVSFTFKHLLAKVKFKFTYTGTKAYRPVLHLIRFDAPVSGTYYYNSGEFDSDNYSYANISKFTKDVAGVEIKSGAEGHLVDDFTCYLLPCSFPSIDGSAVGTFQLLLNNIIYEYKPKSLISVKAGKEYVLNFTIQHNDAENNFFIASYSLWKDGETIEGNLQ